MNNEDFPALPRNQNSESSPDRDTTTGSSKSTWITTQGILEGFLSPANPGRSNSKSYSQLDNLRRANRKIRRTRPLTPTPSGETTTGNSETSASVNTSSNKDQDAAREQADVQSSTLSGYSPGRSSDNSDFSSVCPFNRNSPPRESSEEGSPNTPINNEEDNGNSPNPLNDNDEDNKEEPEIPTPSPSITTNAKMASFDVDLEYLVVNIMKYNLKHPLDIALEQAYITTFDEFRSIEVADVGDYTILDGSTKDKSKLHSNLVKAIQRGVSYARHLEDINDVDCDDPNRWDSKTYSKWTQNGYVTYLNTVKANAGALAATTIGSTTTTIISTAQKDDNAALISWSRKPRDVAKYPFLKTDADYQDWKLKMKRQLIAVTLSRVTESTFSLAMC
jgi:hypothetical protein